MIPTSAADKNNDVLSRPKGRGRGQPIERLGVLGGPFSNSLLLGKLPIACEQLDGTTIVL